MKSSLWFVIVLVTGIVGFLVGYSVSSSTGSGQLKSAAKEPAHQAESAGYGAQPAAAQPAPTPGYGAPAAPAKPASAGGYR